MTQKQSHEQNRQAASIHVGGDMVGRDKITVGDVSGSYNAIGAGASVIVNQIQQALSAVDELEKGIQGAERRLAAAIQRKLQRIAEVAADSDKGDANPYKALLDYELKDAPYFYGRSAAINTMLEKIGRNRLTILYSESGSGKTSLLQAGLASRLLADEDYPLYLRPYNQPPAQFIKKAFLPDYETLPELDRFRDDTMTLRGFLERVTYYLGDRQLIIFLDQFEEFFTDLLSLEERKAFADQLLDCIESDLPVSWVLSLRKEYLADLYLFRVLKPMGNEYFLPTFNLEEAQEVIIEPAKLNGVTYETGLVDQMLKDLREGQENGRKVENISPAQMQLVCYTLFNELANEKDAAQITYRLYERPRGYKDKEKKGAEGILASHLTRVLKNELKGQARQVAHRVLEALVTSDLRRVVRSEAELRALLGSQSSNLLTQVLHTLYDNRLLRRNLNDNDEPTYELTHDYLLSQIALDPELQTLKAAQELLAQGVQQWRRYDSLLAKEIFELIKVQRDQMYINPDGEELLRLSKAYHARRLDRLTSAVVAGFLSAMGGTILANVLEWLLRVPGQLGDVLNPLLAEAVLFGSAGAIWALGIHLGDSMQEWSRFAKYIGGFVGGVLVGFMTSIFDVSPILAMITWASYGVFIVYLLEKGKSFELPQTIFFWVIFGGAAGGLLGYQLFDAHFFAVFGALFTVSLGLAERRFRIKTR